MIFPHIILFAVPIFFSHILLPFLEYPLEIFGYTFFEHSSFERVKVILFFILVFFGIVEVLFRRNRDFFASIKKHGYIYLFFLLFPFLVFFLRNIGNEVPDEMWNFFFLGSYEKFHGYLFYISCVFCYFLFSFVRHKNSLIQTSLISAGLVSLFAILEYTKIWEFFPHESVTWEMGRTLSTLGNPNYVAGYLLLHLPFCFILRNPERYLLLCLFIFAIITTGSFIGFVLVGFFLVGKVIELLFVKLKKKIPLSYNIAIISCIVLSLIASAGFIVSQKVGREKWLSFESRGVLVSDLTRSLVSDPQGLLFGNGPDSIIIHYSGERSSVLDLYFPHDSNIDSSHDLWVDFIYQYGIILFIGLFYLIFRRWKDMSSLEKMSFFLFGFFFSFNIVVVSVIVPILFIFAYDRSR